MFTIPDLEKTKFMSLVPPFIVVYNRNGCGEEMRDTGKVDKGTPKDCGKNNSMS